MNNLKAIRKEKKIRQADVANYLNITNATYSRYETGVLEPSNDTLKNWLNTSEFQSIISLVILKVMEIKRAR